MVLWVLILVRLLPMTPAWNLRVSSRRRLASSVGSAHTTRVSFYFISRTFTWGYRKRYLRLRP